MSADLSSSRSKFEYFLISVVLLLGVFVLFLIFYPFGGAQPDRGPREFIQSINEFEKSEFCQNYGCVLVGQFEMNRGKNNAYQIKNYPVYNEFFVEITTKNNQITEFGISLDPKDIGSEEMRLIHLFLVSFSTDENVGPEMMEFVNQNLNRRVSQICNSSSTQFGSRYLWVGNIGGAPTLFVGESCPG